MGHAYMLNNQIVLFPTIKPLIYHIIPAIFKPFAIVPIPPVISTRRFWTSTWRPWTEWRWPPLQRTPFVCRTSSAWPRRPRWTRSTRRTVEPRRRCMRRCSRRCRRGWGWKRAGFWWKKNNSIWDFTVTQGVIHPGMTLRGVVQNMAEFR